jgi:histidine decarboxylase
MAAQPLAPADKARLAELHARLIALRPRSIGYPCAQEFDYTELQPFLDFVTNNVGDPFSGSNFRMNTHDFEREVIMEFGRLTQAPQDDFWGYMTSGGTEGNMYGLYLARELLRDCIVYFSEDTHYSVAKLLRLQHTRSIMIKSQENGQLDYDDLRETLRIHRDVAPVIFANIGTTMKGAIDDLARIRGILDDLAITDYHIHADAALSGMILPFVENPPPWNFAHGAHTISISGHKLLGCPLPCGLALARKHLVDRIARNVEYVGALDTTITGSRSAITPLMLWYRLRTLGDAGIREIVKRSLDLAAYAVERLRAAGIEAWRQDENSVTVVLPRPPAPVLEKWIIAPKGKIAHIITLPPMNEAVVDEFTQDFVTALKPSVHALAGAATATPTRTKS